MTYIDGFVAAVPTEARDAYLDHARRVWAAFRDHGAARCVQCWGDDIKDGHSTDFRRAVRAKGDETVVFAWVEHRDRASRDATVAAVAHDPRMSDATMPFDRERVIQGGFSTIVDERAGSACGYVDGFLVPVEPGRQGEYRDLALWGFPIFRDHGIQRHVEAWGDDVPTGTTTDFARAVKSQGDEITVFSWFEWADKPARDAGSAGFMADDRMSTMAEMPFDGRRMVLGGFEVIMDVRADERR